MTAAPPPLPEIPEGKAGWPWLSAVHTPILPDNDALPRVTVVTPSFNQADYLEETLRSVLLQGYPNLQLIVVDGGSTDHSVEVIKRYEPHLAWWVSEKDGGQSDALNKGFSHSTGDLHAYLNSDDLLQPGAVWSAVEQYRAGHPWIVGQVNYLDTQGPLGAVPQEPDARWTRWFLSCPISQPGCFWSAKDHEAIGAFDTSLNYFMDYDFWMRLRFVRGLKPHFVNQPYSLYRLHEESKTVAGLEGFAEEGRAVRDRYRGTLGAPGRARVWCAIRDRQARNRGAKGLSQLSKGKIGEGLSGVLRGIATWPPALITTVLDNLSTPVLPTEAGPPPINWPDWDP